MNPEFKFKIGDWVQFASVKLLPSEAWFSIAKVPDGTQRLMAHYAAPVQIIGRLWEECPGGVQVHYRVRRDGAPNLETFHEIELDPYERRDQK